MDVRQVSRRFGLKKKFDYWLYYRKLCIAFIAWFVGGCCTERCVRPGLWAGEGVLYQWTEADVQKEELAARGPGPLMAGDRNATE